LAFATFLVWAVTDWRLRRWRLWFLALMTATQKMQYLLAHPLQEVFLDGEKCNFISRTVEIKSSAWSCSFIERHHNVTFRQSFNFGVEHEKAHM